MLKSAVNTDLLFKKSSKLACWIYLSFFIGILPAKGQHKSFHIYTADEGLISNTLEKIFQDADGFMWFGSNDGLSIFDGYRFTNYTLQNKGLSENAITSFFAKSKEETWVIHSSGIDVFVKRKLARTLPVRQINTIIRTREGRLIGAGAKGLYEIKEEKAF